MIDELDLTDLDNFVNGFPHHAFDRLRAEAPVYFHRPTPHTPGGEGFWVISRYDDVANALRDPGTYSSASGVFPTADAPDSADPTPPTTHGTVKRSGFDAASL